MKMDSSCETVCGLFCGTGDIGVIDSHSLTIQVDSKSGQKYEYLESELRETVYFMLGKL